MALGHYQEEFGILEAVDCLSSMADIDLLPQEARSKIIKVNWLDPKGVLAHQELVKKTFKVIHRYLKDLYEQKQSQLREPETQRAIQAIMVLAKEATQKLDKYTQLFKEAHGATRLKEYQVLQHYYLNEIMQKFQESLEAAQNWKVEVKKGEKELKDLEVLEKDKHYELFLIKNQQSVPYFDRTLFTHIKETPLSQEAEDPFIRFKQMQDADLHEGAKEILELAKPHIDDFYKEGGPSRQMGFVSSINKALVALFLTASSSNLLTKRRGKSCFSYYADFHFYLREALSSPSYVRLIAFPPEPSDHFSYTLLNLAHALCCFFFFRIPHDHKTVDFIYKLIGKKTDGSTGSKMWESFFVTDDQLRERLKGFPHGPVFKLLHFIKDHPLKEGFDPLNQENYPMQLFSIVQEAIHISALRIPCPTKQVVINEAEIIPEFKGLLRHFKEVGLKHLLINLQDRTDPVGEGPRSRALEHLQYDPEFLEHFVVVTFPTQGDFYLQKGAFENRSVAAEFIEALQNEVSSKESGFFFPETIPLLKEWVADVTEEMHKTFFLAAASLTHQERLFFIDVFYHFLGLKLIEITGCTSFSFTSKDTLDSGAALSASFYSFFKLLGQNREWTDEEKEFVLWMFYYFSLMVRERPIDQAVFRRAISTLALFHSKLEEGKEGFNHFSFFYSAFNFQKMSVNKYFKSAMKRG